MPRLNLVRRASRMGPIRLLAGGGRFWMVVTLVAWIFRAVQWLVGREERTVRKDLKPGEKLVIEHSREPLGERPLHESS